MLPKTAAASAAAEDVSPVAGMSELLCVLLLFVLLLFVLLLLFALLLIVSYRVQQI